MSSGIFGIEAVKVNGSTFAGVRGQSMDRGRQFFSDGFDGTVHETMHAIIQSKATAEWDTAACKTMLTALGTSGTTDFPFVALNGTTGLVMYCGRAASNAPGYDATAIHVARTVLNGVVVMERMSWSLGQCLMMHLKSYLLSTDGSTDPISISTSTTFASLPNPQNTEAYTLTALTINGSLINPVNSCELTVGHKFDYDGLAGLPYPTLVSGAGPRGRAEIRLTADVADISSAEGTGAVSAVFTALANGGTNGSSTITMTLNGAWSLEDSISGQHTGPMTKRLTVRPYYNGTTKPLTWATT